jgi:hypothetical protein
LCLSCVSIVRSHATCGQTRDSRPVAQQPKSQPKPRGQRPHRHRTVGTSPDARLRSQATRAPSRCDVHVSRKQRGSRECRVRAAPTVSCAKLCEETHTSIQVQRRHSGIPCAMALRLMPRSPRRRIRLVTVIGGLKVSSRPVGLAKTSADLTPATGARTTRFYRTQPPVFAQRLRRANGAVVLREGSRSRDKPALRFRSAPTLPRPPHPTARFVTIATRPSSRVRRAESNH